MREGTFVMLLLFLCALNINCKTHRKTSSITDREGILTLSQRNLFDSLFNAHEKKTSNEIGLVTTPDYGRDTSILAFAIRFGNDQEIGKKNKNKIP